MPETVAVPDVTGLSVRAATRVLEQAGFTVTVTPSIFGGGIVQSYSPTGSAPQGSTITIDVGFSFP